jgi:hypothetical protein
VYDNISVPAHELGIPRFKIEQHLDGKRADVDGYTFAFVDEYGAAPVPDTKKNKEEQQQQQQQQNRNVNENLKML